MNAYSGDEGCCRAPLGSTLGDRESAGTMLVRNPSFTFTRTSPAWGFAQRGAAGIRASRNQVRPFMGVSSFSGGRMGVESVAERNWLKMLSVI